jgi:hypothetical protein
MIRTIQGDFGADDSPFLMRSWTQGTSGIIANRSRLTDTVIIEPEPVPRVKMDMNTVPYVYVPPTTTAPPVTTTATPTTLIPTTLPTTTTEPPTTTTTTTSSTPPTSTTLTPTSTLPP